MARELAPAGARSGPRFRLYRENPDLLRSPAGASSLATRIVLAGQRTASNNPVAPIPPPTHMVTMP
ncbi:hypothetical protein F7R05_04970 [Pseudomonas koreensis]|nr:hypothetical protein F7R05_04970 [Pseudomonas koreensis]